MVIPKSKNDGSDAVLRTSQLTDWGNEPTVADLKQDLMATQSSHDSQVAKIQAWLDNLNITGSAKREKVKGRSNVQPKLIRKQAEWRYAALSEPFLSSEDIFSGAPVTYEDKQAAIQNTLILNNQFNTKIDKVSFIDQYVRTGVDEGTIIVRVGWEYEDELYDEDVPVYDFFPAQTQEELQEIMGYLQLQQSDPNSFKNSTGIPEHIKLAVQLTTEQQLPIVPKLREVVTQESVRILKNQPTLEICDFNNIHIDPSCMGDMNKAQFVIYSFETSLSELEKSGKYTNLDAIQVTNSTVLGDPDHTTELQDGFNFKDKPRTKFVAYEYWGWWDIDDTGITKPFVATWVGGTMIRMEENPYPDKGVPFVSVQYLPVRREIYGEPDGSLLEDNQSIIGAVTRGAIDIMARSSNGQIGMRQDALDAVNRRRYNKGMDYEFNPSIDPRQAIIEHRYPEIPNSVGLMLNLQQTEADSMTGVRAFGATDSSAGTTATADRGVLDAASKRESGILRRLSKGITDIGRKVMAMNGEFLSEEEVVRVTNQDFITVRRDDLAGRVDLKLGISTAEEDNQKAQELAFMLQTMGNNMDSEMSTMLLADIARLRRMPELAQKLDTYQPQPDPMAALEMQKIQMEIAKLQSEVAKNTADAGLKQAETVTEQVTAGNKQADTDLKNLDFVEKESGVQHARDLNLMGEQAKAQTAMKIVEAQLKPAPATP